MKFTIFRKYLAITITLSLLFLFIGFVSTLLFNQYEREKMDRGPHQDFGRIIDTLVTEKNLAKDEALKVIHDSLDAQTPFDFEFVPITDVLAKGIIREEEIPEKIYDSVMVKTDEPGPPFRLIRLKCSKDELLQFKSRRPPTAFSGRDKIFALNALILFLSTIFASTLSLFLLFYSMKKKSALAAKVIQDIKEGNLKSRFPISRIDELSNLMTEFNVMADEIEKLVSQLRTRDHSRQQLLQQLTHDLRTPIASLKNLLETFQNQKQIPVHLQDEMLILSLKEVDYFERLVEDLLFLAQVNDPQDSLEMKKVSLVQIVQDEIEVMKNKYRDKNISLSLDLGTAGPEASMNGDPHLLQRLIRNALENSISFCKQNIGVRILKEANSYQLQIEDDGPGFKPEDLVSFGEKKFSRTQQNTSKHRLSVGLGSVIMKTVAQHHQGDVLVQNKSDSAHRVTGARVLIQLKA